MNKSKHFLIVLLVIGCIYGAYVYISKSTQSEASEDNGSLVSSKPLVGSNSQDKLSGDTLFLSTLVKIKNIKLDTNFFSNELFIILTDNAVQLETVEPGRQNPFSEITTDSTSNSTILGQDITNQLPSTKNPKSDTSTESKVETTDATKITTNRAILNANVLTSDVVSSSYFEFGSSELLESKTPKVLKTQLGTFATSIIGLKSQKTYYFRAVSVIGNVPYYGEVLSFTTN